MRPHGYTKTNALSPAHPMRRRSSRSTGASHLVRSTRHTHDRGVGRQHVSALRSFLVYNFHDDGEASGLRPPHSPFVNATIWIYRRPEVYASTRAMSWCDFLG